MKKKLHEYLDLVKDEKTFLKFVSELKMNRENSIEKERQKPSRPYAPHALGWENISIESFLDGAISWAEDTDFGKSQGLSNDLPWKKFAVFLYCGKIYE